MMLPFATLTLDQWIQLGVLALTALGVLAAAITALWKYLRNRFGLRFSAEIEPDAPAYVYRLAVSESGSHSISTIAGWMKFTLFNNRPEPISLMEIYAYDSGSPVRKPIGLLYKRAFLFYQTADVGDPVRLPIRLEPHDGIVVWALIEHTIPASLGEILFALYGDHEVLSRMEQNLQQMGNEIEREIQQKINFVEIESLKVSAFSVADEPIVQDDGASVKIVPHFGFIPISAYSEVLSYLFEKKMELSGEQIQTSRNYIVEVVMGNGRRLKHTLRTNQNAFWFFERGS